MILCRIAATGSVLASLGSIAAAGGDGYVAPAVRPATDWIAILYAVAGLVGICVAAFKNSKRTYLD